MTRRGASLLGQADPYLATVRSTARLLPEPHRADVEQARYQLYKRLDRYTDSAQAEAWQDALEAAVEAAHARQAVPEALLNAVVELRRLVERASEGVT